MHWETEEYLAEAARVLTAATDDVRYIHNIEPAAARARVLTDIAMALAQAACLVRTAAAVEADGPTQCD